ncbi:MAG: RagB/SusD family nutrient uptake outer membrane protein, partial [Chitinophagales bacterium]
MTRNYKWILLTAFTGLAVAGCNKSFLDKSPQDKLTESTTFQTYDGFKVYSWGFYDIFEGYGNNSTDGNIDILKGDIYSDNMVYTAAGNENPWAYQLQVVPSSGGDWDFSFIRRANIMLDNVDNSPLAQADKDHWRSVGLLFRSFRYLQLISEFGDVPWLEHVVGTDSVNILQGTRTARDTVAANILRDLQWAEQHIEENNDGSNTVNVNVVRAVISRFGLFEGTWRKYHGLTNATTFLQASRDAALQLINDFPAIHANYDDLYNSESLAGVEGIILYKEYANGLRYHSLSRYLGTAAWYVDMAKDGVESYLCSDGKPISTSPLYAGDHSMYDEFRNRDHR